VIYLKRLLHNLTDRCKFVTLLSSDLWYRRFRYDDTHHWYRSLNVLGDSTDSARCDVRKSNGSTRYLLNRDAVTSGHYRSHFSPRSPGKRNQSRRDHTFLSCRRVDRTCFYDIRKTSFHAVVNSQYRKTNGFATLEGKRNSCGNYIFDNSVI